jgi:hypothetical protein
MSAAVLTKIAPRASSRLLADVRALEPARQERAPAAARLEAALGRDFADKLVSALAADPRRTG